MIKLSAIKFLKIPRGLEETLYYGIICIIRKEVSLSKLPHEKTPQKLPFSPPVPSIFYPHVRNPPALS